MKKFEYLLYYHVWIFRHGIKIENRHYEGTVVSHVKKEI